jgi:DNA-binding LacI/PurR family transcriptional regulator
LGRVRIRDVAELAQTSVSTVSNLLNGRRDRMHPDTVQRIERAIEQLGYRPSWAARQLKTGYAPILGLLVPSVANPAHGALARAIEEAAEERGYQVALGNCLRDPAREARYAAGFFDLGIRGLIIASSPLSLGHLTDLRAKGLRLVAVDLGPDLNGSELGVDSVSLNNREAARLATRHLIELGHRRIGYVAAPAVTFSRQERFAGYQEALAEGGIPFDPDLVAAARALRGSDDTNAAEHGREAAGALLALSPSPPTAIVALNDMHALGACAAIRARGLRVARDVSVVGMDDIILSDMADPPLTTVHAPFEHMGRAAVELLCERIDTDADKPPRHQSFQPSLVLRQSAGPARPRDATKTVPLVTGGAGDANENSDEAGLFQAR